jgi:outer membrane protein assembly factor BamB
MRSLWLVLLVSLLAACSSSGPIHEPTELEPLQSGEKVHNLWSVSTPSASEDEVYNTLRPVIADDVLYTLNAEGVVQAHSLKHGKRLWKVELEDTTVSAGLGMSSKLLLLGTARGEVLALSREDGKLVWRARASSEVLAPPVAGNGLVIVRSGDGVTEALKLEDGAQVWRYTSQVPPLSLRGEATPVISNDLVLLGLANGHLLALSLFDGVEQWESTVVVPKGRTDLERMVDVDAAPLVVGDVIYVTAHQGRVLALSRLTGTMLWSRDLGGSVGMAVNGQTLYLVDDQGQVWAMDRSNGATLWKSEKLKYRELSAPAAYDDAVVVGDFEGYLHWLAQGDGHIFARYQMDHDGIRVAPLIKDNVLYCRSSTGKVEALRLGKQ